ISENRNPGGGARSLFRPRGRSYTGARGRSMSFKEAGLANDYWEQYYAADEVDEIIANRTTTMFVSGHYPIHVGLYLQHQSAPTVLMAHGLFVYGLTLAHLQLPLFRAGFNVVEWDLPGMGQSGGPRGGCTVVE